MFSSGTSLGHGSSAGTPDGRPSWASGSAAGPCSLARDRKGCDLADPERCLQWPSANSIGIVMLSAKFAWTSQNSGGLRQPSDRDKAQFVLPSLLRIATEEPVVWHMCLDPEVLILLPRPMVGSRPFDIKVDSGMVCCLGGLQEAIAQHIDTMPVQWATLDKIAQSGEMGLMQLLAGFVTSKALWPLAAQALSQLALALDRWVVMASGGSSHDRLSVRSSADEGTIFNNAAFMERFFVGYIKGISQIFTTERCFSLATDKGRVHGLPLMLMAAVSPSNQAAWLPPQAASGAVHSDFWLPGVSDL